MRQDELDRYVYRIAQETRAARAARHPRARIAHHMLANTYRAIVDRMLVAAPRAKRLLSRPGAQVAGLITDMRA